MKICGIICELNPPHNGHQFLIEKVKNETNCDFIVAIMSGNFVQRGEPAIFDYQLRAKMALNIGFDAVIYLPTIYTLNSADDFAKYGVFIASQLNLDYLAFGANKTEKQFEIIKNLVKSTEFKNQLKQYLDSGLPYSKAFGDSIFDLSKMTMTANDILGLQYLISLQELDSNIRPIIINRDNNCSATNIRNLLKEKRYEEVKNFVNEENYNLIISNNIFDYDKFNEFLFHNIITKNNAELKNIKSIREGLENKISNNLALDFNDFNKDLKSKRYNQTFLNRLYLNITLNIQNNINHMELPYIKLVAIKDLNLLKALNSKIPFITNLKNKEILKSVSIYDFDKKASKIYNILGNNTEPIFPYNKIIIHNTKGIL